VRKIVLRKNKKTIKNGRTVKVLLHKNIFTVIVNYQATGICASTYYNHQTKCKNLKKLVLFFVKNITRFIENFCLLKEDEQRTQNYWVFNNFQDNSNILRLFIEKNDNKKTKNGVKKDPKNVNAPGTGLMASGIVDLEMSKRKE